MDCYFCGQEWIITLDWRQLFLPAERNYLCDQCRNKLVRLTGSRCVKCSRISNIKVCADCEKWESVQLWNGVLECNHSVFHYNDMMQQLITKWKYRGDYVIREVFRSDYQNEFQKTFYSIKKSAVLVPIPLSDARIYERGFNQAEALVDLLKMPYKEALVREHSEKQSKKTRQQRLASDNPFSVHAPINDPVILIDDIYTTGITLRHAAQKLKMHGTPVVYAFTLARG